MDRRSKNLMFLAMILLVVVSYAAGALASPATLELSKKVANVGLILASLFTHGVTFVGILVLVASMPGVTTEKKTDEAK